MSTNYGLLGNGTSSGISSPPTINTANDYFQMKPLSGSFGDRSDGITPAAGGSGAQGGASKQGSETLRQNENGPESPYGVNSKLATLLEPRSVRPPHMADC